MDRRDFLKASGWSLLGLAASGSLLSCVGGKSNDRKLPEELKRSFESLKDMKVFWGDIHNHCNVTYGHGDLEDALAAAREQLDFCAVTPHALWPDIPGENDPRLNWVIGYHTEAFKRLRAGGWDKYVRKTREANDPGKFLSFTSYECHSMEHGDHVALCYDYDTPLLECTSVPDLKEKLRKYKVFVTPHHMGYQTGFRGYEWKAFTDDDPQLPFVEMFSRHGLAEGDMGDYDYLHDMGPRVWEGSVLYGLEQGHKFGLMCSTDQHAGYPGSYGDGRIGVLAESLDRDKLWDAMSKRHVCGITGDKIKIDFRINGATMGDVVKAGKREIYLNVEAQNFIDYVDLIKNGRCVARLNGPFLAQNPEGDVVRAKIKIDFGWNREEEYVHWQGRLKLSEGEIRDVQTCFRGAAFTAAGRTPLQDPCEPPAGPQRAARGAGHVLVEEPQRDDPRPAGRGARRRDAAPGDHHGRLQRPADLLHARRAAAGCQGALHARLAERGDPVQPCGSRERLRDRNLHGRQRCGTRYRLLLRARASARRTVGMGNADLGGKSVRP